MKNGLIIDGDGNKKWFMDNKLHRTDGPAVEWNDGSKEWYMNDKCHRIDGPAQEWNDGTKCWYLNGKLNRTDGPAEEWSDGSNCWWVDGVQLFKENFTLALIEQLNAWEIFTPVEIVKMKLDKQFK